MLLVDSHNTMVIGVDVHVTTAPPFNPIHPYVGMVIDPCLKKWSRSIGI